MTDYGVPTTPGEALRRVSRDIEYRAKELRNDARTLIAQAEVLEKARWDLLDGAADMYDKWQPKLRCPAKECDAEKGHDGDCPQIGLPGG